ncbi:heat repeat-containing protein [Plakobranchus ocellatus]|uniref:Heat repeat-containing protein n=1 Tax=Plakobranchus ocellatus TaxID=259542 RepID=A0AAV4DAA8_9GAST|nr:heat repeat-containing protein [Plakobranchus ocellatus]
MIEVTPKLLDMSQKLEQGKDDSTKSIKTEEILNNLNLSVKKLIEGSVRLLDVATKNPDVVIVSEALNSLFDVFKEDHTDPIAKHIGSVDKLRSLQPSFKAMVRRQICGATGFLVGSHWCLNQYVAA